MKTQAITTTSIAASIRKPMPPPARPFKVKREKRNAWKKEVA